MIDAKVTWLSELVLKCPGPDQDPDDMCMILHQDFCVKIGQIMFLTPAGMLTDGASIPRFFWRLIGSPFTGPYRRAAIFHDAAYKGLLEAYNSQCNRISERLDREAADGLLLVLMEADGAGRCLREVIYKAVRFFGKWSWKE